MRWVLFLQDFNYTLEHRPGTRMNHVDALSRVQEVLILEGNTLEQNVTYKQDSDPEVRKIRESLEHQESQFYELRNGLVYRKSRGNLLFVIPETMEYHVMTKYHDEIGHFGLDKMIELITRSYLFPRMRNKIKQYIGNCFKCIAYSPVTGKKEAFLRSIEKGDVPFHTIHIDHV
ncbi:Integrase zinc binding domain [Popillia japonica]|uniref:RNA-directed DNA polymerase n=1 Tax=Popillia japonica TaxID=7064 RepID=A0AAW1I8A5_POPJA